MEKGTKIRLTLASALVAGTLALGAGQASAMPAIDHGLATAQGGQIEQARWVCGPWGRCWWRPGPRFYGGYGFYRRPWGWRRW